jgi:ferrous iron transport protein A
VRAGAFVQIKELLASPEACQRLRELGLCERKRIRCLLRNRNIVCQVCNVRLGISAELADHIWVEPLEPRGRAA